MASGEPPRVILLGGPNGAGKTTTATRLLPDFLSLREFVNADAIAAGLSAFDPESVAREAGRTMIRRIRTLVQQHADFAFETTLASRSFAPFLVECHKRGYQVTLLHLWLRSPDLAVERVSTRVRVGGHSVPGDVIRRRYVSGWRNFLGLYAPIADTWLAYDNSGLGEVLVAHGGRGAEPRILEPDVWTIIADGPRRT